MSEPLRAEPQEANARSTRRRDPVTGLTQPGIQPGNGTQPSPDNPPR